MKSIYNVHLIRLRLWTHSRVPRICTSGRVCSLHIGSIAHERKGFGWELSIGKVSVLDAGGINNGRTKVGTRGNCILMGYLCQTGKKQEQISIEVRQQKTQEKIKNACQKESEKFDDGESWEKVGRAYV